MIHFVCYDHFPLQNTVSMKQAYSSVSVYTLSCEQSKYGEEHHLQCLTNTSKIIDVKAKLIYSLHRKVSSTLDELLQTSASNFWLAASFPCEKRFGSGGSKQYWIFEEYLGFLFVVFVVS